MMKLLLSIITITLLSGCAFSFEEARLMGIKARVAPKADIAESDRAYCRALDGQQRTAQTVAVVFDVLAGTAIASAAGLLIKDEKAGSLVTIGISAVLAGGGVASHFISSDSQKAWVRECVK